MEEQKPLYKPEPGIPEALHPEIGNQSALEKDKHAFLLRTPDPGKQLEALIPPSILETGLPFEADERAETTSDQILTNKPEAVSGLSTKSTETKAEGINTLSSENEVIDEPNSVKSKKKKKEAKEKKSTEEEVSGRADDGNMDDKPQKAAKLLRKAAKSVKKHEEGLKSDGREKEGRPEPSLSPFTFWLKNLSGSDYVHPYDDDFAIEQAAETSRAGISETFADLLAAQGYKDQAREMYLKLMQKYPEKSGFFAAKIEALQ